MYSMYHIMCCVHCVLYVCTVYSVCIVCAVRTFVRMYRGTLIILHSTNSMLDYRGYQLMEY